MFIAIRVITGLGEGAFYSNDRSLIAEKTPVEKRSLGMGVVITGLALGITISTVFAPNMIDLGGKVFSADDAWRMAFLILGGATLIVGAGAAVYFSRQERGLPYGRATLHLMGFSAIGLAAVMAVYFVGDAAGLSDVWIALLEVALALALVGFVFSRGRSDYAPVLRNRDLILINLAFIAVLWNLWFFSFWSVSIVAEAAHSSFGRSALIAAFNAGAGILGFPVGGWLSDVAVRRGIGRKPLVVSFTAIQCALTVAFGIVIIERAAVGLADGGAAVLGQHVLQRHAADRPRDAGRHRAAGASRRGVRHEQPDRGDRGRARAGHRRHAARRHRRLVGRRVPGRRADRRGGDPAELRARGEARGCPRPGLAGSVPASPSRSAHGFVVESVNVSVLL